LPKGATASFSPTSVTSSGTSTLKITTAISTPKGNYKVTVTGTSNGVTHSVTLTLKVTS
jgi:hypothetical protein